jgi:uridine kinase
MITGLLRNFHKSLYVFLKELANLVEVDIYIYTTKDVYDKKFLCKTDSSNIIDIINEKFCKLFAIDGNEDPSITSLSQREKNVYYQWKKIFLCFQTIPKSENTYIIRMRPDLSIQITPLEFLKLIHNLEPNTLYIPSGNDLFTSKPITESPCINDQVAIGTYDIMKKYSEFYNCLVNELPSKIPILSEVLLYKFLEQNSISIRRFDLPYRLYLSDCSVVAICGNSGVGKSTVLESIQKVFPFDSKLQIETDRYHKWERNSREWKTHTHLNPNANNLEKLTDDTYLLKMGETVEMIDYDHASGKFTAPVKVESKNFIFLCGLHTFYKDSLRKQLDFKLFIDTEDKLNCYWKVRRDTTKRGHSIETILKNIEARRLDYEQYIKPQKSYADCILHIRYKEQVPDFEKELDSAVVEYSIEIKTEFIQSLNKLLTLFSSSQSMNETTVRYTLYNKISRESIVDFAKREAIFIENIETIEENYLGVLQIIVLLVLFK